MKSVNGLIVFLMLLSGICCQTLYGQGLIKFKDKYFKNSFYNNVKFLKYDSKILLQVDTVAVNNIPLILNFSKECTVEPESDLIELNDSIGVIVNFTQGVEYDKKITLYKVALYRKINNIWSAFSVNSWNNFNLIQNRYSSFGFVFNSNKEPVKFIGKVYPIIK